MKALPFKKLPDIGTQLARYRESMPGLDESYVHVLARAWPRVTEHGPSSVPAFRVGVAVFPKLTVLESRLVAADKVFGTPLNWPAMNRAVCALLETIDGGSYLRGEWERRVGPLRLDANALRYARTTTDLALERDYPGDFIVLPVFLRESGADPDSARAFPLDPFMTLCLGLLGSYPGRMAIARGCELRDECMEEYFCGFRFPGDEVASYAVKIEALGFEEPPGDGFCYAYGILPKGVMA